MVKALFFFFVLLIQSLPLHPVFENEILTRMQRVETLASAEDGSDTNSGSETATGEDDIDADTDSDSDDDADRGDSSLTPAEQ